MYKKLLKTPKSNKTKRIIKHRLKINRESERRRTLNDATLHCAVGNCRA